MCKAKITKKKKKMKKAESATIGLHYRPTYNLFDLT